MSNISLRILTLKAVSVPQMQLQVKPSHFRGSWRGKMGSGISLIVDWENGIYTLGLGFSHWEWDEQL